MTCDREVYQAQKSRRELDCVTIFRRFFRSAVIGEEQCNSQQKTQQAPKSQITPQDGKNFRLAGAGAHSYSAGDATGGSDEAARFKDR